MLTQRSSAGAPPLGLFPKGSALTEGHQSAASHGVGGGGHGLCDSGEKSRA